MSADTAADAAGFSERSFAARYDDEREGAAGGEPAGGASAPAPARSRNAYMRSRARRLAAGQPG